MSLDKTHPQKFFKRLRKRHDVRYKRYSRIYELPTQDKISYYLAGEYGEIRNRPHYHAIIFNAHPDDIYKAWKLGEVHYGEVNQASIGYTLKYMSKDGKIPAHQNDDRIPEFSLMSKGIGKNYLTSQIIKWHKADLLNRMYCNLPDGKKIAMPKYYKDKIYNDHERKLIGKHLENQLMDEKLHYSDITSQNELDYYNKLINDMESVKIKKMKHNPNKRLTNKL